MTKGSGSNGIDTVYTVSSLPMVAEASAATSLSGAVTQEALTTVMGPTYGTVYRGVACSE